jgi:hypothetical protein
MARSSGAAEPVPSAPPSGSASPGRLALVSVGLLLYLVAGVALAAYCFERNARKPAPPAPPSRADEPEGDTTAPPPPLKPTVVVSAEEQHRVDGAIARGVWFLKEHQSPDGTWSENRALGYTALAGLTLLECGLPADDPAVQKAAAFVRREVDLPVP